MNISITVEGQTIDLSDVNTPSVSAFPDDQEQFVRICSAVAALPGESELEIKSYGSMVWAMREWKLASDDELYRGWFSITVHVPESAMPEPREPSDVAHPNVRAVRELLGVTA